MENSCTNWDAPHDFDSGVKPINIWGILTAAGFFPSTVTNWVLKSTKTNTQSFPKGCFAKNLVVFNVVLFSRSCFDSFPMSNKLTSRMLDHTVVGLGLGCPSSCIQNELLNTSDMQWRVVKAKGQRSQIPLLWCCVSFVTCHMKDERYIALLFWNSCITNMVDQPRKSSVARKQWLSGLLDNPNAIVR